MRVENHLLRRTIYIVLSILLMTVYAIGQDLTNREKALKNAADGVMRYAQADRDGAKKLLDQALTIDASVYEAHFWLGRIYAEKAGSSEAAKREAIEHFRTAVQLQPYGDEGNMSRAWLLKMTGRPKDILFVPVRQIGNAAYDQGNTDQLIAALIKKAAKKGDKATQFNENWQNRFTHEPTKDDLRQLGIDENGLPSSGWVVFVGVSSFKMDNNQSAKSYHANGSADVWMGDPVSNFLYPKAMVRSSQLNLIDMLFNDNSYDGALKNARSSLGSYSWDYMGKIFAQADDAQLIDEIIVPQSAGIYYRTTAKTVTESRPRAVVALYAMGPDDELNAETQKKINSSLQRYILVDCKLNCISPTYPKRLLDEAPNDLEQVAPMLLARSQSDFTLLLKYNTIDVKVKNLLLGAQKKLTVELTVDVVLASRENGIIWHEPITIKLTSKQDVFIDGDVNVADDLIKRQGDVAGKVIDAIKVKLTAKLANVPAKVVAMIPDDQPEPIVKPEPVVETEPVVEQDPQPVNNPKSTNTTSKLFQRPSQIPTPPPSTPDGLLYSVYGYTAPSGSTLVPLRGIAEWCGAEVLYDAKTSEITCATNEVNVKLRIGAKQGIIISPDGSTRTVLLSQPATEIDGVTLVPLRFIGEAFGCEVTYHTDFIPASNKNEQVFPLPVATLSIGNRVGQVPIYPVPPSDIDAIRIKWPWMNEKYFLSWPSDLYKGYAVLDGIAHYEDGWSRGADGECLLIHRFVPGQWEEVDTIGSDDLRETDKKLMALGVPQDVREHFVGRPVDLLELPVETDHYKIEFEPEEGNDLLITLYAINNGGMTPEADRIKHKLYHQQLIQYRTEALAWLKKNGVDPAKIQIIWIPND